MNLLNVQNEFRNKGRFQFAAVVLRETDENYMNSFSSINKELVNVLTLADGTIWTRLEVFTSISYKSIWNFINVVVIDIFFLSQILSVFLRSVSQFRACFSRSDFKHFATDDTISYSR